MENIEKTLLSIFGTQDKIANLIISLVIFVVLIVFKKQIAKGILNLFARLFLKNKDKYKQPLKDSLLKPLSTMFLALGIFALVYINNPADAILKAFKITIILIICWGAVNYLSNNLFLLFHGDDNSDVAMNATAIKFINNILKIVIIAFAIVMIISELGYNINGLIAGLGVGGLAISLAAQDAISNMISGFIIIFEKPFTVGEMILGANVQGVVEEVMMRSTRIRTLDDSVVTVPNSKLTGDAIVNLSRINKRLIDIEIGLTYSTDSEMLEKCRGDIEDYLKSDENVLPAPIRVNFSKLDDSSLNIAITCYTTLTDKDEYLHLINDINFKIKNIVEGNGADFAYPSTSVYIEKQ